MYDAVCAVRSIGLAYTAATGSTASRAAAARDCSTPLSERWMPGMRPESSGPVCAVTPCRTSTSRVGGLCSVFSGDAPLAAAASVVVAAVSVIGVEPTGDVARPGRRGWARIA